jgi:hypothetical protein
MYSSGVYMGYAYEMTASIDCIKLVWSVSSSNRKTHKNAWVKIGYPTMFSIRGCLYVPAEAHIQQITGGGGIIWDDFPVLQQTFVGIQ